MHLPLLSNPDFLFAVTIHMSVSKMVVMTMPISIVHLPNIDRHPHQSSSSPYTDVETVARDRGVQSVRFVVPVGGGTRGLFPSLF